MYIQNMSQLVVMLNWTYSRGVLSLRFLCCCPHKVKFKADVRSRCQYFVLFLIVACFPSGPRLDMDPDIVAALDEDFDYNDPDNILEDDFIIKANSANGAVDIE